MWPGSSSNARTHLTAKPLSGGKTQKLNMKVIQRHGRKWRVQKRSNGQLRKWTYGTLQEAQRKRDMVFGYCVRTPSSTIYA